MPKAFKYTIPVCDSVMDSIRGYRYAIDEIWIPSIKVVANIVKHATMVDGTYKCNAFFAEEPRNEYSEEMFPEPETGLGGRIVAPTTITADMTEIDLPQDLYDLLHAMAEANELLSKRSDNAGMEIANLLQQQNCLGKQNG